MRANMNGPLVGKLIALEGKKAAEITVLAQALKSALTHAGHECVISRWNASDLFSELLDAWAEETEKIPARTLAMLHAADLAQRINSLIRSALSSGFCVIADQYLYTALAVASALGVDPPWAANLYAFAPQPDMAFYFKPPNESSGRGATSPNAEKEGLGFYQFCLNLMTLSRLRFNPRAFEKLVNREFDGLVGQNKLEVIRSQADLIQTTLFRNYDPTTAFI